MVGVEGAAGGVVPDAAAVGGEERFRAFGGSEQRALRLAADAGTPR